MTRTISLLAAIGLLLTVACQNNERPDAPRPVVVTAEAAAPAEMPAPGAELAAPPWVGKVIQLCEEVKKPERKERTTEGWQVWQDRIDVKVKDFRLYSPLFRNWVLAKVDDDAKTTKIKHRGPFFGYGMTVEVTNNSDQVLLGDTVYVWATFTSKTGERVCFAKASEERAWNPFANKGEGGWVREKEYSEWPLRPTERKRYNVAADDCFAAMFLETELTNVKVEAYVGFRPMGAEAVVMGPVATFDRPGALLRGLPVAEASRTLQRVTRKGLSAVTGLLSVGSHVLVSAEKKVEWIGAGEILGLGPNNPIQTTTLPATAPAFTKTYGSLSLRISDWKVQNWIELGGKLKQGHKLLTAQVDISVDTSKVTAELEAAVNAASAALATAESTYGLKSQAADQAKEAEKAAKGTEGYAEAKAAAKAAKAEAKTAKKALKSAQKVMKSAQKALGKGVSGFLKAQAKAVDCGSFQVDVGRKALKPTKDSFGSKTCKALTAGVPVSGRLAFDLERWDMPFVLKWKGPGKAYVTHVIASQALARIPKE